MVEETMWEEITDVFDVHEDRGSLVAMQYSKDKLNEMLKICPEALEMLLRQYASLDRGKTKRMKKKGFIIGGTRDEGLLTVLGILGSILNAEDIRIGVLRNDEKKIIRFALFQRST